MSLDLLHSVSPLLSGKFLKDNLRKETSAESRGRLRKTNCVTALGVMLGVIAAGMSLWCNWAEFMTIGQVLLTIVYAIGAFLLGGVYIVWNVVLYGLGSEVVGLKCVGNMWEGGS